MPRASDSRGAKPEETHVLLFRGDDLCANAAKIRCVHPFPKLLGGVMYIAAPTL